MNPPAKPPRRPAPDASRLPIVREDIVPGIPKQNPPQRILEAARQASRASSPELIHEVEISGLKARVGSLESRVDSMQDGQVRVIGALDTLTSTVKEWELKAAGGEAIKVQEEQKTKRLIAIIGLITMIVAPSGTLLANYFSRPAPSHTKTEIIKSKMEIELESCETAPNDQAWTECRKDAWLENTPQRKR